VGAVSNRDFFDRTDTLLIFYLSAAAGQRNGQSDQIKTIEFEKKRGMDSNFK
jgi:hypothetical protein